MYAARIQDQRGGLGNSSDDKNDNDNKTYTLEKQTVVAIQHYKTEAET